MVELAVRVTNKEISSWAIEDDAMWPVWPSVVLGSSLDVGSLECSTMSL